MKLGNYTVSDERTRLSGQLWQRGSRTGMSTVGAFIFGLPFIGMGCFIALIGLKVVHVNPRSVHAPYAVLFVAGLVFYLAGLWIWMMGYNQYKENCRRAIAIAENPGNPALVDYPWDTKGFTAPRWTLALKNIAWAMALTIFLSMFNWWAWFAKGGLFVQSIVGLFDILLIALWSYAFLLVARAWKFGKSRIEFTQFPYYTGSDVVLRWLSPTGIGRVESGSVTLRCVQQWWEMSGSGSDRSKRLVQEAQWSGTWPLNGPQEIQPGKIIELHFATPSSAQGTDMSADKPIFWELEITLKERGPDFKQTHLIPVYARPTSIAATALAN